MVKAICKEIELRSNYLETKKIDTLYFGGGTPSLLSEKELNLILETVTKNYILADDSEITLEANPDDINKERLQYFRNNLINRLSIGIQTFNKNWLKYFNRAHTRQQSFEAVSLAQDKSFNNISIDLIYGIAAENHEHWLKDLNEAISLQVQHISSYCLTIEPKTVFGNWIKRGKIKNTDDEFSAEQFEILVKFLEENNFEQYEISNFSKPGLISRHNSNYWMGKSYLGIGPSAHSFDKETRQYNVSNNSDYMKSIERGLIPATIEQLSKVDKINEYIMTSIRTKWGCDLKKIDSLFGVDYKLFEGKISSLKREELISYKENVIKLTLKGKLLADKITEALFFDKIDSISS